MESQPFFQTISEIPELTLDAGPMDEQWTDRLKEEYKALIAYVKHCKEKDSEWFKIKSDKEGKNWTGTCWYRYNLEKYEFQMEFTIPATYPSTPIEIKLPELEGKTEKMYKGGKICIDIHFSPLWQKNSPRFGIAHALIAALGPWLAAEVPVLVDEGRI